MKTVISSLCGLLFTAVLLACFIGCEQPMNPPAAKYVWLEQGRHAVAFTSKTCQPCKQQEPEFRKLADKGIQTHIVDVKDYPQIAREYGVQRVPHYLAFENGEKMADAESVTLLIVALKALVWILSIVLL